MATDWSEEAKARRSASAKKAAETRRANREVKSALADTRVALDSVRKYLEYTYYQGTRLARLLCRTASPYTLFVATWRVAADEIRRQHHRIMVPRNYVLTPSRHKRPFWFA